MIDTSQYQEALRITSAWSRAWIITHARPDGDAIGALVGAGHVLRSRDTETTAIVFDPVGPRFEFLVAGDPPTLWQESMAAQADRIDGILVVDTCAANQLEPVAELLKNFDRPIVVFDHHQSHDLDCTLALVDVDASATSLMIAEWAQANRVELDARSTQALFVGLACDTGWFRFSNADRRTFESASRLIGNGVKPAEIFRKLYCSDRPERLSLIGKMLGSLELHADGKVALACITRKMIEDSGARSGDMDELSSEIGRIGSVICWALFTEIPDHKVRVNLRCKHTLNVARIAEALGGGGHPNAAGVRLDGQLDEVKSRVLQRLLSELGKS
jgi:phosphoesterase RecJ-like protein